VEEPDSVLDSLRHYSVFANELCELTGEGLFANRGKPLSELIQRFEQSFSITKKQILKLLNSEVEMVKKYAAILDVDPEKSPFIQNLHKFLEVDEELNAAKASESKSDRPSKSDKAEDSPTKQSAPKVKGSAHKESRNSRSSLKSVSLPKRIWRGFAKLLGF
jgi:L-rhamnose isomerase